MIRIKANFNEGADVVEGMGKQLPFAVARTLTAVAQDGQKAGIAEIEKPGLFTLRNDWTERGTRITPATKTSQVAEVYTDTSNRKTGAPDYMVAQQDGGEKIVRNGRHVIAIPTDAARQMAGGKNKPIPNWLRPKNLIRLMEGGGSISRSDKFLSRRGKERSAPKLIHGYFFWLTKLASGAEIIMCRYKVAPRDAATVVWLFVSRAHIRKRFHLDEDVQKAIDANLQKRWDEVIQDIFPLKI